MAITLNTDLIQFKPRRGETFQVVVTYPDTATSVVNPQVISTIKDWITVTQLSITEQSRTYEIVISPSSPLSSSRSAKIVFSANTSDGTETETLLIYQIGRYRALWRDEVTTLNRSTNMSYTLTDETNKRLYKGSAASINGRIELNIPRIVDGVFEHPQFDHNSDGDWYDTGLTHIISFRIENSTNPYSVIPLIYDWRYDSGNYIYSKDTVLNTPINNHSAHWMYQPLSIYNDSNATYLAVAYKGNEEIATYDHGKPEFQTAELMSFFDNDISQADRIVIYANDREHPVIEYDLTHCGDWALYYLNKMGGHDAFMIEGNVRVVDNIDRDQYTQNAKNTNPSSFAKTTIQSRISTTYELSTGWLTDEESEILASQLMSSPQVFLHNRTSLYIPTAVNITDTSVEHKKFRNGKQLNRYTITVEESQTKLFK